MFPSTSYVRSFVPAFAVLLSGPLLLAHCSAGEQTWTDPNNSVAAATLTVFQPVDATGHIAENHVGQPVTVQITMMQTGPGTCRYDNGPGGCGSIGNTTTQDCTVCSGPDSPLDYQLTSIGCDQDLCQVVGIEHGDSSTGDTVTIIPAAGFVTVRATAQSGSLVASGSVQVAANCIDSPSAPDCQ